jgi:bacillithiol biosynthesis cysteine-adding enzyme BshC
MSATSDIPFRNIPNQSSLYLNYLALSPLALRFYRHPPTLEGVLTAARQKPAGLQFPRKSISSILRRQNEMYGGDSVTMRRIDELEGSDSVAILTGQQVGVFTGPLYTVYKALTAIRLSGELRKHGIKAVPVFWMDTEDHDLPEVTRRTVLDTHSSVHVLDYRSALFDESEASVRPVGSLQLTQSIQEVIRDYAGYLPASEWKPHVQSLLESAYRPGASLALSFARLLSQILKGSGLILFDPQDPEAKPLATPVFQKALRSADAIHAALVERNRELGDAGFHTQVSVMENSTVLFYLSEGERRALERRRSGFGLRHSDRTLTLDELLSCAERTPEKLSPNVLLRPLVQDYLFPTIAYVGGSSELAYFAQIEALYAFYDHPMPVLWPRNGHTLIDSAIGTEMERLGIEVEDCFQGEQLLIEKAVHHTGAPRPCASLEQLQEALDRGLTEIRPELQAVEPPLVRALETARRKIMHNIRHLRSQIIRLEGVEDCSVLSAVRSLLNHCFPNRNLQERELNIFYFLARYGPQLLDTIGSATEIENFAHRVIRLEDKDRRDQGFASKG